MTDRDLTQTEIQRAFESRGDGPWTVVHDEVNAEGVRGGSYCALADPGRRGDALGRDSWLATKSDGGPGFAQMYEDGQPVAIYLPRGKVDEDVELLVLVRDFHGAADPVLEIDQQFRLFHNLRYVAASDSYVKMNDDGTETAAVRITGETIEIRTSLLKQYIAARQMDLLLFTDMHVYSHQQPAGADTVRFTTASCTGRLDHHENRRSSLGRYSSRYCATKVIAPGPVETCGIWPYETADSAYPAFIIGEDQHGRPVTHTCDPAVLGNYFGANPDAPHYLTPVHFRREVLAKYYADSQRYTVSDGYLRCAQLWGLQIDNDHDDRVVVFLGDLGRDLPPAERDHWRSYMMSADAPISVTNFRRSFLAQPADAAAVDLTFRRVYHDATRAWEARHGWPLFREPNGSDVFLLQQLRIPLNDTDNEFEEAIKLLAKLMSDALNEKAIGKELPDRVENEKGISKLQRLLTLWGYPHVQRDISFLRRVQELRSKVSAHLKGRTYEQDLTKNLGDVRGPAAVQNLLGEGVTFLRDLIAWVGPAVAAETATESATEAEPAPGT
ncbi:hypothetical protein [Actinoplanes sp. NPDC051851]|uniref:hypothetical protein n=1 Tax=Actinoplanes sp. NPDC051851 TaxID=3154753 RepID=UPI00341A8B90